MCEKEGLPVEKKCCCKKNKHQEYILSEEEKRDSGKTYLELLYLSEQFSEKRSSELGDEFVRLKIQVATILLAFESVFLDFFAKQVKDFNYLLIYLVKLIYVSTIFLLFASIILGLYHITKKQKFWDEIVIKRVSLLFNWRRYLFKKINFEEAEAFHKGATSGSGEVINNRPWTGALQTVFLGLAIGWFSLLFLIFIFAI